MKFNILVFLFILFSFCNSQNKTYAQPQLWDVYSTSDQPFINVTIDKYESYSLYIKSADELYVLHQDSIKYLLKRKDSNFGLGFLFGAIVGGIFGIGVSSDSNNPHDIGFSGIGKCFSIVLGAIGVS